MAWHRSGQHHSSGHTDLGLGVCSSKASEKQTQNWIEIHDKRKTAGDTDCKSTGTSSKPDSLIIRILKYRECSQEI